MARIEPPVLAAVNVTEFGPRGAGERSLFGRALVALNLLDFLGVDLDTPGDASGSLFLSSRRRTPAGTAVATAARTKAADSSFALLGRSDILMTLSFGSTRLW